MSERTKRHRTCKSLFTSGKKMSEKTRRYLKRQNRSPIDRHIPEENISERTRRYLKRQNRSPIDRYIPEEKISERTRRYLKRQNRSLTDTKRSGKKLPERKKRNLTRPNQSPDIDSVHEKILDGDLQGRTGRGQMKSEREVDGSCHPETKPKPTEAPKWSPWSSVKPSQNQPVFLNRVDIKDGVKRYNQMVNHVEVFNIGPTAVILFADSWSLNTYYEADGKETKEKLELSIRPSKIHSLARMESNTAGVLCGKRRFKMAMVYPTLTLTDSIDLKEDYAAINIQNDGTIIGLKFMSQAPFYVTYPVLIDREGNVLQYLRTEYSGTPGPSLASLYVAATNDFTAVVRRMDYALCFSRTGKHELSFPFSLTIRHDVFYYDMSSMKVTGVAYDSQSNIYFAVYADGGPSLIVKLDNDYKFLGGILSGDKVLEGRSHLILHIDTNDKLYVFSNMYHYEVYVHIYQL